MTPFGQSLPSLNGNSYHGSNPTTVLSWTLSLIPHCCPQKQQCVFTTLSICEAGVPAAGRGFVEMGPVAGDQLVVGDRRSCHQPKPPTRADWARVTCARRQRGTGVLVVAATVDRVVEPDLREHVFEIGHLLRAGERSHRTDGTRQGRPRRWPACSRRHRGCPGVGRCGTASRTAGTSVRGSRSARGSCSAPSRSDPRATCSTPSGTDRRPTRRTARRGRGSRRSAPPPSRPGRAAGGAGR